MRKVQQKFFSKNFILLQYFYFFLMMLSPYFHIFSNFINTFLWQDIVVIKFFYFSCLGLINKLINKLELAINKFTQHKCYEQIRKNVKTCNCYTNNYQAFII